MVKILPYDPKVEIIWSTPNTVEVVTRACSNTQKGIFAQEVSPNAALVKFLYNAEHGNPLEHAVISFDITQISRACADQLRTHRITSPTMSSTHYQDHSDYPHRVSLAMVDEPYAVNSINCAMEMYHKCIAHRDMLKEDARQLLPLSTEVRYILTVNAQSLAHMLYTRMCYRNTIETILCAERMHRATMTWFPELFAHVGRSCDEGSCKEGKMRCDMAQVHERLLQYD